MNWEDILKNDNPKTWNAYIRDSYDSGVKEWLSIQEATVKKGSSDHIETDSQDETYKLFREDVEAAGFKQDGDKNNGTFRKLVEGFMQSLGNDQNFDYIIAQERPDKSATVHVDTSSAEYWKKNFDASYDQLQNQ